MPDQPRTRHSVRMSNGHSATIDVEFLGIDPQCVAAIQGLASERFIQFPKTDVVDRQTTLSQQFGNCQNWAEAHFLWGAARHRDPR